jgi:hypothetical protein
MSEVKTEKLSPRVTSLQLGDSGDTFTVPSGATLDVNGTLDVTGATVTGLSAGKVLQVVQTVKSDTFSTAATNFTDITGLNASITPSSSSSKILIQISIGTHDSSTPATMYYRLMRDSTPIGIGDSSTQTTFAATIDNDRGEGGLGMMYLDSPSSTSSINYKVQTYPGGTSTLYINYRNTGGSSYYTISTITLMEIGA